MKNYKLLTPTYKLSEGLQFSYTLLFPIHIPDDELFYFLIREMIKYWEKGLDVINFGYSIEDVSLDLPESIDWEKEGYILFPKNYQHLL